MVNDKMVNDKIVYTTEEVAERLPSNKKIGSWGFHENYHEGHKQILKKTQENSDYIIGVLWNNLAEMVTDIMGQSWEPRTPIYDKDVEFLCDNSDVVMIFTGNYRPWRDKFDKLDLLANALIEYDELPFGRKEHRHPWELMRACQVMRLAMNRIWPPYYTCGSYRDIWRPSYREWYCNRFPGYEYELIEPVRDEHGNDISSTRLLSGHKATKCLLRKGLRSKEELEEYVSDQEGLEVTHFIWNEKSRIMHGKFLYGGQWFWICLKDDEDN
jgi:hypothetical protein